MNSFKNNGLNYFILFAISLLTLSSQDHKINPGLDGSYYWAFSYIFNFIPQELNKITFTYGPLALLNYPVCYSWLIILGCLFQIFVKFTLGSGLYKLSKLLAVDKRIAFALFVFCCFTMFSAEAYFNLIMILFLMIYYFENKFISLILVAFVTTIGYYYKCSIGLSGVLLQGSFLIYTGFQTKKIDWKLCLKLFSANFLLWILIGLLLFKEFGPILESLSTYYQNIIMYNETSAYYNTPDSILLLLLCSISLIAIFFINQSKDFKLFWLMALLFLYTGFTHSLIRMDHSHYMGFLLYLILIIAATVVFYKNISKYTFVLLSFSFFSYYGNIGTKHDYSDLIINIPNGPRNFANYVINHSKYKAKCLSQSSLNLSNGCKLDAEILSEIKKGTVDFFPWELTYVEANKLTNWKPRPYLQSLKMSPYFDKKTATYFASKEAPDYIIWHSGSATDFLYGIDNSYFLNNEYHTITSILENYCVIKKRNNVLLLSKRNKQIKIIEEDFGSQQEINSGEWITLPKTDYILGCSVSYDFNLLRGLKKLSYRDDEFFIEYRTQRNLRIKEHIWPAIAKDFIWLNPIIKTISDSTSYKDITEIRFSNTNKAIHSGKLKIQFKTLKFEGDESKKALYKWFNP